MVEKNTSKKSKTDHSIRLYKQTKLSNSWLLSKTEDLPTSQPDRFETILSPSDFKALLNKMETMEPPPSPQKRPFSNSEHEHSPKRIRSKGDMVVDEKDNWISGLGDNDEKVPRNGSVFCDSERRDQTDNFSNREQDPPANTTRPRKSLLPINQLKSPMPITIFIRNKNGRGNDKIPIEKTVPGHQRIFRAYIDRAFEGVNTNMSSQTIHEIFSYICRYGSAQVLFTIISDSLRANAGKLCQKLESMASTNINFLAELISQWDHYQKILATINDVCSELNFHYICKETNSSSLLDFGLRIYTDLLTQSIKIKKRMVANIIYLMECERNKVPTDNMLIQSVLKLMYQNIPAYIPYFENEVITTTTQCYNHRSSTARPSMTIQNYIVFAIKLMLAEPILKQEYRKYLFKSAIPPADIVMKELLLKHIDHIVQKDFRYLIELEQHVPLKALYTLVSPYDEITAIQTAFGHYIKDECEKLCQNHRIVDPDCHGRSSDDKNQSLLFVVSLLQLKSKVNSILVSCFGDDTGFQYTLKDSFEVAINLHQASSAQHIACYIDDHLESPWPLSPSINQSLDDGIGLLRSLQVEEVFKSHYSVALGIRLLRNQQKDTIEKCTYVAQRLKSECGAIFTKDMDVMIDDIQRSGRQARRFKEENRLASIEVRDRIDMDVRILTSESWSLRSWSQHVKLPNQLLKHQEIYHKFYQEDHPRRRLNWMSSLGTCVIEAAYPECKLQLVTTEIQALILLLFNNTNIGSLSMKQICEQTGIDKKHVKKSLKVLSCQETPLLLKQQQNQQPNIPPNGSNLGHGYIFSYNKEFNSARRIIEIQDISAELTSSSLKVMNHQALFTRSEKVQALIMKILKHHRRLSMNKLQQLVIVPNQMSHIDLPLAPALITTELEHLVERGFVMHKPNGDEYVYCE